MIQCLDCKKPMNRTSNAQKRCVKCRKIHNYRTWNEARVRRGERRSFGQGRGGRYNGGWKDGRSRKWYGKFKKKYCEHCGTRRRILGVHHKDGNHSNSFPSNFITICNPCHRTEHARLRKKYEDPRTAVV